jgi:HEAT repeat protein
MAKDQAKVLTLLGWYEDPPVADIVRTAVQSPDKTLRKAAIQALGNTAQEWKLEILLVAAADADAEGLLVDFIPQAASVREARPAPSPNKNCLLLISLPIAASPYACKV